MLDTETVTVVQLETAAEALTDLSNAQDVVITDTILEIVVEVANIININSDPDTFKKKDKQTQAATK